MFVWEDGGFLHAGHGALQSLLVQGISRVYHKEDAAFFKKQVPPAANEVQEDKSASSADGDIVHIGPLEANAIVTLRHYSLNDDGEAVPGTQDCSCCRCSRSCTCS